jgi:hypothetical protein
VLLASLAAYNKYGDRAELDDKSLKGTKEALDTLLAYLGSNLAERVKPTIERILENAVQSKTGTIKEIRPASILEEFSGEAFRSNVGTFVTSGISELVTYQTLSHARDRWQVWANRICWGVYWLLAMEGIFTVGFVIWKISGVPLRPNVVYASILLMVLVAGFCILCDGVMKHYYGKIARYRDQIL